MSTASAPQSVLHTVHSSAVSCSFQYPPIPFMSPSSCPHSPSSASHPFCPSFYLPFNYSFYKTVPPTQDVTNPVSLPSYFICRIFHSSLTLLCFISHTIGQTDPLQCPISKLPQYFCSTFHSSGTTQCCSQNVALQ